MLLKKKKKKKEVIIPDEPIIDFVEKASEILDYEYLQEKEPKEQELQEIKNEYNFDDIFEKIN